MDIIRRDNYVISDSTVCIIHVFIKTIDELKDAEAMLGLDVMNYEKSKKKMEDDTLKETVEIFRDCS